MAWKCGGSPWLPSDEGLAWLYSPTGMEWQETRDGREWFEERVQEGWVDYFAGRLRPAPELAMKPESAPRIGLRVRLARDQRTGSRCGVPRWGSWDHR